MRKGGKMPIKILMPALSPTMTHGTLAKWVKLEGDDLVSGEVLAEIETDKATMEIEVVDEGKLGKILIAEGTENVPVNEVIALLFEDGEDIDSLISTKAMSSHTPISSDPNISTTEIALSEKANNTQTQNVSEENIKRINASPLAKRLAKEKGIDLISIKGSGPHGRIIKRDIVDIGTSTGTDTKLRTQSPEDNLMEIGSSITSNIKTVPLTPMRKAIAKRLTESARDIPHFNISADVQIDAMLEARKRLNSTIDLEEKISINDYIIKALSLALSRVPSCNVSYTDEAILYHEQVDISFAVSIEGGLITPIIHNVAGKGFISVAKETKSLVKRAKEGKLKPNEYEGGTFTVSNMGMYGVTSFNSIINPPQAAILSVGAGKESPIVTNGEISTATIMNLTLAVDHRCIDGATAATFMGELKAILEEPLQFML